MHFGFLLLTMPLEQHISLEYIGICSMFQLKHLLVGMQIVHRDCVTFINIKPYNFY